MSKGKKRSGARPGRPQPLRGTKGKRKGARLWRSEERFSRNAETDLVCRLLLEKKKTRKRLDPIVSGNVDTDPATGCLTRGQRPLDEPTRGSRDGTPDSVQ